MTFIILWWTISDLKGRRILSRTVVCTFMLFRLYQRTTLIRYNNSSSLKGRLPSGQEGNYHPHTHVADRQKVVWPLAFSFSSTGISLSLAEINCLILIGRMTTFIVLHCLSSVLSVRLFGCIMSNMCSHLSVRLLSIVWLLSVRLLLSSFYLSDFYCLASLCPTSIV